MNISNDNLCIRSAKLSDAVILTKWWNDGSVMAHAGFPNGLGTTVEKTEQEIKANESEKFQLCIIEINGIRVGEMNYQLIGNGDVSIGIKICDPNYQNHGYGTKLLEMFIQYLWYSDDISEQYTVTKIVLDTNRKNKRARHVYEKIGFTCIGIREHAWQDQLGQWQDAVDFEMNRPKHPYMQYCNTNRWKQIDQAIQDFVENQDLEEKTRHEYIVGYLCKCLDALEGHN